MSQSKSVSQTYRKGRVYRLDELRDFVKDSFADTALIKNERGISYFNIPAAFDIETSNFYQNGEKCATMYIWMLGINGNVITGRKWSELADVYDALLTAGVSLKTRLIVYVHNLDFEFQFIRKYFTWKKVFSIDMRKPIYALTSEGVEFRCSYKLSSLSLEKVGKNLTLYPCEKKVGQLDYSLIRHSETPLTAEELEYCIYDVYVLMAYIAEKIEQDGNICKIPLTNTGYVRNYCRRACLYNGEPNARKTPYTFFNYRKLMAKLTLDKETYEKAKEAFAGGYVHADALYVGKVLVDVDSYDLSSAYPAQMCSQRFPMGGGKKRNVTSFDELEKFCKLYSTLCTIRFHDLEATFPYDHYISYSKVLKSSGLAEENGRVIYAEMVEVTITDVDLEIIKQTYSWSSADVTYVKTYERGYLPRALIDSCLTFYGLKTVLKGVEGKESEYMAGKGKNNSMYGVMVTDIVRASFPYTDDWEPPTEPDYDKQLEMYNRSVNRFTFYLWGVWITAYCRSAIWEAILECKEDYGYSDTDCVKIKNRRKHEEFFKSFNARVQKRLERMCKYYDIDPQRLCPVDQKGKAHPLGFFEHEGTYDRFKTLGAKRYIVEKNGKCAITVAGLGKGAVSYMEKSGDAFAFFSDDMYIPAEYTGKLTHTYIDDEAGGDLTDYLGTPCPWHEKSMLHLEPCDFTMSLTDAFIDYLKGVQDDEKEILFT